ncbi:hypothetical protein BDY19DRAFT_909146 [Irpex rosettiformis]|uniref:Uncharacterized protein n=1 Tax=Irpex rosettiformis TaxID=378272 RepID=A0ACB8TTG7_9APHY|nr:hypothetical protein BDY19DRAFT_909146 [Irpex rosettiformis]
MPGIFKAQYTADTLSSDIPARNYSASAEITKTLSNGEFPNVGCLPLTLTQPGRNETQLGGLTLQTVDVTFRTTTFASFYTPKIACVLVYIPRLRLSVPVLIFHGDTHPSSCPDLRALLCRPQQPHSDYIIHHFVHLPPLYRQNLSFFIPGIKSFNIGITFLTAAMPLHSLASDKHAHGRIFCMVGSPSRMRSHAGVWPDLSTSVVLNPWKTPQSSSKPERIRPFSPLRRRHQASSSSEGWTQVSSSIRDWLRINLSDDDIPVTRRLRRQGEGVLAPGVMPRSKLQRFDKHGETTGSTTSGKEWHGKSLDVESGWRCRCSCGSGGVLSISFKCSADTMKTCLSYSILVWPLDMGHLGIPYHGMRAKCCPLHRGRITVVAAPPPKVLILPAPRSPSV